MANLLTILCEEGVATVDMIDFALKHDLGQVFDLISQRHPDITSQHYLLRAIALEQKDVVCNLLSQGVWHGRAIATAAKTENESIRSLLAEFLRHLGFEDVPHYLRMHPEQMQINPTANDTEFLRAFHYELLSFCQSVPSSQIHYHSSASSFWGSLICDDAQLLPTPETSVRHRLDPAPASSSRRMMGLGIGLTLRTLCSELAGFVSEEQGDHLSVALQTLCRYRLVWRDGIRAIRRLINGTPPTTAYEMLTLLMSTYATAGSGCGPTQLAFNRAE